MSSSTVGRSVRASVALAVALLCVFPAPTSGQSLTEAEITGSVRTAAGDAIPRAVVSLLDPSGGSLRSVDGGLDGSFAVRGLGPGVYDVRVEALGFAPRIYRGLRLRPGSGQRLNVVLRSGGAAPDTVMAAGSGQPAGSGRWLDAPDLTGVPRETPALSDWASLSTLVSDDLGMEGLPGQYTRIAVDGLVFRPARAPGLRTLDRGGALLTARTLSALEVAADPWTLEVGTGAGGLLSAHSLRGGAAGASADGAVSAGGLRSAATDPDEAPDALSFWGGASAAVVLSPDTSSLVVGADAWQVERPRAGLLPGVGVGEAGIDDPYLERRRGFAGFVRLDRVLAEGRSFWGSARVAVQPGTTDLAGMAWGIADGGERVDFLVGTGLLAPVGRRETLEARVGVTRSAWTAGTEAGVDLPFETGSPTVMDAATGLRAGPGPLPAGITSRTDLDAMLTLHVRRGDHHIKGGAQGGFASHSQDWGQEIGGAALVGSGSPTSNWTGVMDARTFRRLVSASIPRFAVFVEDAWSAGPGLTLDVGARFTSEWLPLTDEVAGATWFQETGLAVPVLAEQVSNGSGFLGFRWDGGSGTRVTGRASYSTGEVDPLLFGEILASTEFLATRLSQTFPGWPAPINPSSFPSGTRPGYAYLVEDPEGPATFRVVGAVARTTGATTLEAGAVFRRTDGLTRRRDLNRPALPRGIDGGGRALWGQPLQIGSWIGGAPETLGRFGSFGPVWELDQGGWSEYLGVTMRVAREVPGGVRWSAEYTWSQTEDNMPGLGVAGRLAGVPLEGIAGDEVTVGVSDLDRPHRAVAVLSLPLPFGEGGSLSGVYRFQSGAPFTPGYVSGVDANMDGVPGNEPAFVTAAAEQAHGSDWSCLKGDVGGFVTRNACRAPDLHTLDLRLSFGIPGIGGMLFVDALNVLDREMSILDTALLRIDPDGAVTGGGAQTRLPFEVNPGFGTALVDRSTGRTLRVGLRIGR